MTRLLSKPELWKFGTGYIMDGPHGISLTWDNLLWHPNIHLTVDGKKIEGIGFLDGLKIRAEAKRVETFLLKVRDLEQEKKAKETIDRLIAKVTASES